MANDELFPFSAQQASRPVISIKPRARLPEATRASLRAASSQAPGEALRLPLADIDEDPHQPRTVFDGAELQSMADSIRAHGVVQPIVVRPSVKAMSSLNVEISPGPSPGRPPESWRGGYRGHETSPGNCPDSGWRRRESD